MIKKKKAKKSIKTQEFQKIAEESQPNKSNTLIFSGVLLAISSICLLIYVLNEKVFHLS